MKKSDGKWFLSKVRSMIKTHGMLEPGDRLAIALSGRVASCAMLYILASLQTFQGFRFSLHPVHVAHTGSDLRLMELINTHFGLNLLVVDSPGKTTPNDEHLLKQLVQTSRQLGCNKLALAHHADDVERYFFRSLFGGGCLSVLPPVEVVPDTGLTLIRPLLLVPAQTLSSLAKRESLPATEKWQFDAPVDNITRAVYLLKARYPDLTEKLLSALYPTPG